MSTNNGATTLNGTIQNKDLTEQEYGAFSAAFVFFNARLFGGALPACLITLQR
jgi:hypothetical protein